MTGYTEGGFPTTGGAFDTSYSGPSDAFVARLNATGTALIYPTYLGGGAVDGGNGIAVNAASESKGIGTMPAT